MGVSITWHTSFVGVPGYSWYCLPGSRALAIFISTTELTDRTDMNPLNLLNFLNPYLAVRQKHKKPLGEDGGLCPAVMLPLWSYKSELLTPKPKV